MSSISPVLAPELCSLSGIRHGYFTRRGGISTGIYNGLNAGLGSDDQRDNVLENRKRMTDYLKVAASDLASPFQIHSPDVVVTQSAWNDDRPKADGVVTNTPGLAISVVTADCGPILFADEKSAVIGACHAGWKGALTGVMENTIAQMQGLGAKRENIVAVLGPTISQENYQVGPDFPEPFLRDNSKSERYFSQSEKPDHHMFDLTGYIVDRLQSAGVKGAAVNRCTYAEEENFYSYRRTTHAGGGDYGRQLSAIVLNDN